MAKVVIYPTRVDVNHAWIGRQFMPGGSASAYLNDRVYVAVAIAKQRAPSRTGFLKASIKRSRMYHNAALRESHASIGSDAYYAGFVELGTKGPIVSSEGPTTISIYPRGTGSSRSGERRRRKIWVNTLVIPRTRGGAPRRFGGTDLIFPKQVRGQRAQHYLESAIRFAFRNTRAGIVPNAIPYITDDIWS